jgi:hypothetical protein
MLQAAYDENYLLRQKLAKSEARVAELRELLEPIVWEINRGEAPGAGLPWHIKASNALEKPAPGYLLRKQAEAVEAAKHEHALTARIPDGTAGEHFQDGFDAAAEQYDMSLDRYAQRLRQQAEELEKSDGWS